MLLRQKDVQEDYSDSVDRSVEFSAFLINFQWLIQLLHRNLFKAQSARNFKVF